MIQELAAGTMALATVVARPYKGPQTWGLMCPVREVFFGGARGGGKSIFIILRWIQHAKACAGRARGLVCRRTREQLKDFQRECLAILGKIGWTYKVVGHEWTGPDGSVLTLAYLENDADAEQYQGWNLSFVAIDEAGNFPSPEPIDKLRATLRLPGCEHLLTLTGNPGGAGHRWLKERYIDPATPMTPFLVSFQVPRDDGKGYETLTAERVFIPSRLKDNPGANTPEYKANLAASGPAWLVKAWLEGDWDVVPAGGVFDVENINFGDPPAIERRVHGWDTAYTEKTKNDESARMEIGRDPARRIWIMDLWHGHGDVGMIGRKIVSDAMEREVRWVRAEGGPAGLAIRPTVRDAMRDTGALIHFDLVSHMHDKIAKNAAFAAAVNTGQVWIPGRKDAPPAWWPYLRDQLLTFDGVDGKRDDCVDAGGVAFREVDKLPANWAPPADEPEPPPRSFANRPPPPKPSAPGPRVMFKR